ncbi:MAG: tRNA (guanosine(46)-N7)-methyltransferase TrmB [Desulfuromonadales bacterium C00003094]|nr:MAG: tRNA (guanosine(46)-N7)-methyltransferase TrmB [Desulfuromonadales bacterium C00003094]
MTQRIIEITSPTFLPEQQLEPPVDFSAIFGNDNPLALEIGCGLGDFIEQLAAQQPQRNFLAIDIYNKGCYKTCRKIDKTSLSNVRVMRIEARFLLDRYLTMDSLDAVYINCPDPWPKKRHHQRRLLNREFLQTLLYYLRPGGELFFSTDFAHYAEQVAPQLLSLPDYQSRLDQLPGLLPEDYPRSKYMRRFIDLGQPIYFLHCSKRASCATGSHLPAPISPGFRTPWSTIQHG